MFRAPAFLAAFALCGVLIGGAVWLRWSLASAFSRGEAYGRALAAVEAAGALEAQRVRLEAARAEADRQAAALEIDAEDLREKLDAVERRIASAPDGARNGAAVCLDAGLVRALDAIRVPGRGARAP